MEHVAFPSIEQFRNVIRDVKHQFSFKGRDENGEPVFDPLAKMPKLKFRGTVKLHGTNASIVFDRISQGISFQSRNNIITVEQDNAGFARAMTDIGYDKLKELKWQIIEALGDHPHEPIIVYGEWCGKGIQKGVAISELDKMFVIFQIRVGDKWLDMYDYRHVSLQDSRIFNIIDFPHYEVEIDFEHPELIQNELIELTEAVEKECPVGKALGVNGIGEGVVWTCIEPNLTTSRFWFKVKGEKHSVSKVKTLAAVDVEKVKSLNEFVERTVTENRLMQGIDYLKEQHLDTDMKNIGTFIRWIFNDVMKEERDTLEASGLKEKELGSPIANVARKWYITNFNK